MLRKSTSKGLLPFTIDAGRKIIKVTAPYVTVIVLWQLLSTLNLWPRVLFPSPTDVLSAFAQDLRSGSLILNLGTSLYSLMLGFMAGAGLALPLSYLMGLNRSSRDFFDPIVNLIQSIPGLAWIPFAILWFGLGQGAVTFIVAMSIFFPILYNVLTAIRLVQSVLIEATQTLGGNRKDIIVHVIFPATLPHLMTGVRLGISFGFRSLVGGEMIASTQGIGYAIYNAQQYFQSAHIVVGMLAIGVTWLFIDRLLLRPIESRTIVRWGIIRD